MRNEAFIDSNLLVLLVVGSVDPGRITSHSRTRTFTPEDYKRLLSITRKLKSVFVMPNTLTEVSNLLKNKKDPRFLKKLQILIENSKEIVVASEDASRRSEFVRLGLTDSALLEVISAERPLITVDLELYGAAMAKGKEAAINFTHLSASSYF